jgi:SPP1 family predicted phage head-tail adaptor
LLNRRVTIQSRAAGQDNFGEPNGAWSDVATVWAAVAPVRGAERYQAAQTQAQNEIKVTIRYRAGLTPKNRLMLGARVLDIENIVNINERNETLEIFCKEAA